VTALVIGVALALAQFSQPNTGELRVAVKDASGLPVAGIVEVVSDATQFREILNASTDGVAVVRRIPFGTYRVAVTRDGFAPFGGIVDVRSVLPTDCRVTLNLAPVQTQVTVSADDTLLDVHEITATHRIGADALQHRATALPGRALPELVNTEPGWLLEANGILHPRGSEYQTQYVIDGLPLTDNRSPAFAPEIDADDVHGMNVLTGGYPAEYGRKLGGVIEVVTSGEARRGLHGSIAGSFGRFSTKGGDAIGEYAGEKGTISFAAGVADTDRYLDAPVEENFTNHGTTSHLSAHVERDLSAVDRLGVIVRHGRASFQVPNELEQEEAGQRQDRDSRETMAQFSYQHISAAPMLADLRGMVRGLSAGLWSNAASTPIAAEQDRGFREVYLKAAVSGHSGVHEWKAGGDASIGRVRERFAYRITDEDRFDDHTPAAFSFASTRSSPRIRSGADAGRSMWGCAGTVTISSSTTTRSARAWAQPGRGPSEISCCARRTIAPSRRPPPKIFCSQTPRRSRRSATRCCACRSGPRAAISSKAARRRASPAPCASMPRTSNGAWTISRTTICC